MYNYYIGNIIINYHTELKIMDGFWEALKLSSVVKNKLCTTYFISQEKWQIIIDQ